MRWIALKVISTLANSRYRILCLAATNAQNLIPSAVLSCRHQTQPNAEENKPSKLLLFVMPSVMPSGFDASERQMV